MNYREDLEFQLQKVTLAMQEVVEDVYITCLLYTSDAADE